MLNERYRDHGDSQTKRYVAVSIVVVPFEHIRHPLQADARLHKQIEAHGVLVPPVVCAEQMRHELRAQPVAKGNERFLELVVADVAAPVDVEPVEEAPPGGQESPETAVRVGFSKVINAGRAGVLTRTRRS